MKVIVNVSDVIRKSKEEVRVATPEERAEIVANSMSMQERAIIVYVPIVLFKVALTMLQELKGTLSELRNPLTKKISRRITDILESYKREELHAMGASLWNSVNRMSEEFHQSMARSLMIYHIQYGQALLSHGNTIRSGMHTVEEHNMLAQSYLIEDIIGFILAYDRESSKKISEKAGAKVEYTTEDNHYCLASIEILKELRKVYSVPITITTNQQVLENCRKVFSNNVSRLISQITEMVG